MVTALAIAQRPENAAIGPKAIRQLGALNDVAGALFVIAL
jgi:hypothetical protein